MYPCGVVVSTPAALRSSVQRVLAVPLLRVMVPLRVMVRLVPLGVRARRLVPSLVPFPAAALSRVDVAGELRTERCAVRMRCESVGAREPARSSEPVLLRWPAAWPVLVRWPAAWPVRDPEGHPELLLYSEPLGDPLEPSCHPLCYAPCHPLCYAPCHPAGHDEGRMMMRPHDEGRARRTTRRLDVCRGYVRRGYGWRDPGRDERSLEDLAAACQGCGRVIQAAPPALLSACRGDSFRREDRKRGWRRCGGWRRCVAVGESVPAQSVVDELTGSCHCHLLRW